MTNAKMASITRTLAFCLFITTELKDRIRCPFTYVISNYGYTKFHSKQKFSCHKLLAKFDYLVWNKKKHHVFFKMHGTVSHLFIDIFWHRGNDYLPAGNAIFVHTIRI
jgi:hypothetical protein